MKQINVFDEKTDASLIDAKKAESLIDEIRVDLIKIYKTDYSYEFDLRSDLEEVINKMNEFRGLNRILDRESDVEMLMEG